MAKQETDEPNDELTIQDRAMGRIAGHAIRSLVNRLGQHDKCPDCENVGDQPDGACSEHTTYGKTADEIKAMAREKQARSSLQSERNRQLGESIAALKGDTRPSEWNLLHTRTVEPLKSDLGPSGVTVIVGTMLPGLPGSTPLTVIDVKKVEHED